MIPDLLTKTTPSEPSSWHCSQHNCEVPNEVLAIGSRQIAVRVECPACAEVRRKSDPIMQSTERHETKMQLRRERGVPERYLHASFRNFREETPAQQCVGNEIRAFVNGGWQGSPGLLFLGNVGTAKTLLGSALVNHWLDQYGMKSARFCTILELALRVKATWNHNSFETESMAYQRLRDLPLLVIDEIGVQFGSPAEKTIFTEVINQRYNALHPTILIGNLTINECTEVLGERVMDRFRDGGHVLVFSWPSQRGAKLR